MALQTLPPPGRDARETLRVLRAIPGILPLPPRRSSLPFSLIQESVPLGRLTEISGGPGSGKSEAVLRFAAEHPQGRLAWVEADPLAFPPAFASLGVRLERVLFAQAGRDAGWAALQVLRSSLFQVVALRGLRPGEALLHQIQLEAEKAGSAVFLLEDEPLEGGSWALALRLTARRSQSLRSPDPLRVEAWKAEGLRMAG